MSSDTGRTRTRRSRRAWTRTVPPGTTGGTTSSTSACGRCWPAIPTRTTRPTFRRGSRRARCRSGCTCSTDYSDVYKISGSSRTRSADGPQWGRRGSRGMRRQVRFRCRRPLASGPCPSRPLGLTTTTNFISITYFITPSGSP